MRKPKFSINLIFYVGLGIALFPIIRDWLVTIWTTTLVGLHLLVLMLSLNGAFSSPSPYEGLPPEQIPCLDRTNDTRMMELQSGIDKNTAIAYQNAHPDETALVRMEVLLRYIHYYYMAYQRVPSNLKDLMKFDQARHKGKGKSEWQRFMEWDPHELSNYQYMPLSKTTFKLCRTFQQNTTGQCKPVLNQILRIYDVNKALQGHLKGNSCYLFEAAHESEASLNHYEPGVYPIIDGFVVRLPSQPFTKSITSDPSTEPSKGPLQQLYPYPTDSLKQTTPLQTTPLQTILPPSGPIHTAG